MHAEAFSRPEFEFAFRRSRAAAAHRLLVLGPVENCFRCRIVLDHTIVVVVGVVRQCFNRRAIARFDGQRRLNHLAEIAPVHCRGRNRQLMVIHACLRLVCGFESRLGRGLVSHDLQELRSSGIFRSRQHLIGGSFLDDRPIGQKHRSVRDLLCEADLVG